MATLSLTNPNTSLQVPPALSGANGPSLTPTTGSSSASSTNPGLSLGGGTDSNATGNDIFNTVETAFNNSPDEQSILSGYQQAQTSAQQQAANAGQQITDTGNQNINYQGQQDTEQGTAALEANRGFVVNPGQIAVLQQQSTQRIHDLTQQMNDALANNNSSLYSTLSDLSAQENTAITNARTSFLSEYFGSQSEARSEQLQPYTVAQTQAETASSVAAATLAQAQAGQTAALTPSEIEENLAAAGASAAGANASNATAAQTNALTSFLQQGNISSSDPNVQSLISGSATPQEIQDKYPTSLYGGYAAAIISAAQSAGYNLNTGTLTGTSEAANANSLGAGGFEGASTAATNLLGDWVGKGFGSNPTSPEGPGVTQTVQVNAGNSAGIPAGSYTVDANGNLTPIQ